MEGGGENNQCFPMSFEKNAVSKMMTFFKRSFEKKRSFLSTDTVFDKHGLRQHLGRWHWLWGRSTGTSHVYVTPTSSTQEGFL